MSAIIGISLGNTSSSISYVKEDKLEVIANQDGERAIPSALAYAHGDEFYGGQAKQQLIRNASNTVAFFRDFIGVPFSKIDPTANHSSAHPIEVDGKPGFEVKVSNGETEETEKFTAEQAVVRLFKQLKESAKDYIGEEISGAILTVPSDFSEDRRQLLSELSAQAGLPVLQVINEVTAALLAHTSRVDLESNKDKLFVVADFGGIRSDGAVVAYNSGVFTILATAHDHELGGRLIDEALVEFLAKDFEKQYSVDPRRNDRAMAKLTAEAELLKKTLSNSTTAQFGIESVAEGNDFSGSINRLRFEMTARPVLNRLGDFVKTLVAKAGLDVLDVDEVLLVGGTSWIPKVSQVVADVFDSERTVVRSPTLDTKAIDPDELIARGAAIQGQLVSGFEVSEIKESEQAVVVNVPHIQNAIGLKQADGSVVELLGENSIVPVRKSHTFETAKGELFLEIVEVDREIQTEIVKPEPAAQDGEDDESDWDEDEEEYEVRKRVLKAGKTLAELSIKSNGKFELILSILKDHKLQIVARAEEQVAGNV